MIFFRGCKHHFQEGNSLANLMAFRWRNDLGASLTWLKTRSVWILFGLLAIQMTDFPRSWQFLKFPFSPWFFCWNTPTFFVCAPFFDSTHLVEYMTRTWETPRISGIKSWVWPVRCGAPTWGSLGRSKIRKISCGRKNCPKIKLAKQKTKVPFWLVN